MMIKPLSEQAREAVVLLVEDNPDHVFLARESFDDSRLRIDLRHVESGDQCMAFLRKQPPYDNAPRPDLILLDLHLPRMNGYEVMEEILKDENLRSLPVIVLTTSAETLDVNRMYALRCNSYMTKPVDFEGFTAAVKQLTGYWLNLVIVPKAA
jgi:CheY-like chemotaxis protein